MIGVSGINCFRRFAAVTPSISGIETSRMTRSGLDFAASSIASWPLAASGHSSKLRVFSKRFLITFRTAALSSTMRIRFSIVLPVERSIASSIFWSLTTISPCERNFNWQYGESDASHESAKGLRLGYLHPIRTPGSIHLFVNRTDMLGWLPQVTRRQLNRLKAEIQYAKIPRSGRPFPGDSHELDFLG